jgi:hypothetical protein
MAATLDDLLTLAAAIRIELRGVRGDLAKSKATTSSPAPAAPPPTGGSGGTIWSGLTTGLAKVVGILGAAEKSLISFGGQLASFVGKANPAAVIRFNRALDDTTAVLGQILTPVLERVTLLMRGIGDALASLSPTAKALVGGLGAGIGLGGVLAAVGVAATTAVAALGGIPVLIGTIGSAIAGLALSTSSGKQLMASFGGVLKLIGSVVEGIAETLVPVFNAVIPVVSAVVRAVGSLVSVTLSLYGILGRIGGAILTGVVLPALEQLTQLLELLAGAIETVAKVVRAFPGMGGGDYDPTAESSVGAAVRRASISEIGSFATKAYTSAYGGSTADIPGKSLEELKGIRKGIDEMNKDKDRGSKKSGSNWSTASSWFAYTNPVTAPVATTASVLSRMQRLFS